MNMVEKAMCDFIEEKNPTGGVWLEELDILPTIANRFSLSLSACHNVLDDLVKMGTVGKEERGFMNTCRNYYFINN